MLATVTGYALDGIKGFPVEVEVFTQRGLPSFETVGLPASAVKEAKERVRSAIKNSGFDFGSFRTVVNLAPADVRKEGSALDLAIAIGYLCSTESVSAKNVADYVFLGELSLDGSLRRINGVMPMLISALQEGFTKFVVPESNAKEASFVTGAEIYAVKSLSDAVNLLIGFDVGKVPCSGYDVDEDLIPEVDISDIKGQLMAKRALEIAVSGAHNLLMSGSPGTGKTMLARCVTGLMPKMTFAEAVEVTKIHSVSGLIKEEEGIVMRRPFRTPHHTASLFSITGGGSKATPGEVSLAHNGVLFLDEMPEYPRKTLEALRQPLEDGVITVSRVGRTAEYPADFMLIASMNPCPCGYFGSSAKQCTCTPREILNYVSRISGPLLDRIDIYIEVNNIEYDEFRSSAPSETSAKVRERVERAREIQRKRFAEDGIYVNSRMNNRLIKKYCAIDAESEEMLGKIFKARNLSPRAATRILKTARTIADLAGRDGITFDDVAEAIQYKTADKKEMASL